ncbi:AAEL004170-PB [Aedes aegypti]|uniref:AAEL004170-PB n=1 Tax=Aedes aegypti TaxID=7159 RepID=Q0IFU8_AEDAE|nr:AAEL004170-PB [Aedes aegypti]
MQEVCRLCLNKLESEVDTMLLSQNETYVRLVKELLCIEILEDSSRDCFMCSTCRQLLNEFSRFKNMCQENDTIFRSQYKITSTILEKVSGNDCRDEHNLLSNSNEVKLEIVNHDFDPGPSDEKCNKQLKNKKMYSKVPCTRCGKLISKNNMAAHMGTHQACRITYPCGHCEKVYSDANNLKKHINTHTKSAIYRCGICAKSFDRTDTLSKHKKVMHSEERNHVCTVCGKGFALKQSLTQHLKSAHSNTKTKECKECGMLFKFNNELKMHMIKHTKERQHPCPMCSKQFSRTYYLNVHIKRIHSCDR